MHAACSLFLSEDTEANLLVGTSNAFNSLNRQTALHNIQGLCPSLATALINMYRAPSELYVDGDVLLSQEGTTQGDPLAMPMYALATIPLIGKLKNSLNDVHIRHRHLVMDKYSYLVIQVKKERIRRQTSTPGIEPRPGDWESSAPSTKSLPRTKACLPILSYMLAVFIDYSVNIPLTDHLNLVPSEPL